MTVMAPTEVLTFSVEPVRERVHQVFTVDFSGVKGGIRASNHGRIKMCKGTRRS
jgi:hypothetical protein